MKDIIDAQTTESLRFYGGRATQDFYAKLKQGAFESTRCRACSQR